MHGTDASHLNSMTIYARRAGVFRCARLRRESTWFLAVILGLALIVLSSSQLANAQSRPQNSSAFGSAPLLQSNGNAFSSSAPPLLESQHANLLGGQRSEFIDAPPLQSQSQPSANGSLGVPGAQPNLAASPVPWTVNAFGNAPAPSTYGGTYNSSLLPQSGLVIPDGGGQPFPAAGLPAPSLQPEQVLPADPTPMPQTVVPGPLSSVPISAKRLRFSGRSSRLPTIKLQSRPDQGDTVATVSGGLLLSISGVQVAQGGGLVDFGTITIEADNAVIWVAGNGELDFLSGLESLSERPVELYLEGNIVFREGQRVIYADRMYYNVAKDFGTVLEAEVLTPVPQFQGLLRMKADVIRQRDRENFTAFGAAFTSSRLGVPRYWLQGDRVEFQDRRTEADLATIAPTAAGKPTNMFATSRNNFVYLAGLPVAYWPVFSSNVSKPSFYLTGLKAKNDDIFGTQVMADFDMLQLLGIGEVSGTDWTLSTDYLSKRGPAIGSRIDTDRPSLLLLGPTSGFSDLWIIDEHGNDFIGSDRSNLFPEKSLRGRTLSRLRSNLGANSELWLETGWISDRNFLEQYFENEWDQQKDFSTALRFRHYNGNRLFDATGQARINDFFTESEWLPRLDHYWLGQDLFGSPVNFSAHSSVGYAHQRPATVPLAPVEAAKFAPRPWESDSEGIRATTRQEVNLPIDLGSVRITPFLSGEAAHWGEDVTGEDLTRLTGQGGLRASLPFWRAYPNIDNRLFDIRGIAHKITLESEIFYADTNQDLSRLPLYDALDDNSQEHFRRRFFFNTFGGALPPEFDERSYAIRNGMQRWITAASSEVVDDVTQVRLGVNQRWQTKRGLPGRERIVDWVALDVDWVLFPKAEEENFGEDLGAFNYDFRYHVGDRLTFLSKGYFDVFSQGLKTVSAGAMISRPGRGNAYLGLLSLEGPISSAVINGNVNYSLNDKWVLSGSTIFDLGQVGNVGQSINLTRIGESALLSFGINVDSGRDNVVFNFNLEPRFVQLRRSNAINREFIRPVGMYGLE